MNNLARLELTSIDKFQDKEKSAFWRYRFKNLTTTTLLEAGWDEGIVLTFDKPFSKLVPGCQYELNLKLVNDGE